MKGDKQLEYILVIVLVVRVVTSAITCQLGLTLVTKDRRSSDEPFSAANDVILAVRD
jgi:hypothetical protein